MPARSTFDWALVRVVPRVDRGEQLNAGAILYCRTLGHLDARVHLDRDRLRALDPHADIDALEEALAIIPLVARGDATGGPIARMPHADRFHWLTATRSTIVQPSPIHTGLCADPGEALDRIVRTLVLPLR